MLETKKSHLMDLGWRMKPTAEAKSIHYGNPITNAYSKVKVWA